jgi:cell division protein FtsI/penicillin-binding protein 2
VNPLALISFLLCAALSSAHPPKAGQISPGLLADSVRSAMRNTAGTALVLDVETNQILAAERPELAAHTLATPGSTLKPFFLLAALQAAAMPDSERVYCRRSLRVAGRPMNCVHPPMAHALDAREALAYSCNTYFAELASRLYAQWGGAQVAEVVLARGLDHSSTLIPEAAQGSVRTPQSVAQAQLLVLGVEGITTSPLALAEAYRGLALEITRPDAVPAAHVVAAALEDSVRFGMADSARVAGIRIAGKTGTASAIEGTATHGWFVGYAPADKPRILVVVFLPRGRGSDAARCAGAIFAAWSGRPA